MGGGGWRALATRSAGRVRRQPLRRWWRLVRAGRNTLARRTDRVEAGLLVAAIIWCLTAVPVSVVIGSMVHARELPVVLTQLSERHQVTAVTLADSAPVAAGLAITPSQQVPGRWRGPDGRDRTGNVPVEPGSAAGTVVPIWVDRDGQVTSAPMTPADADAAAWGSGFLFFAGAFAAAAGAVWFARRLLDRRRAGEWDREWESFMSKESRY
jgi:hypothetical protein